MQQRKSDLMCPIPPITHNSLSPLLPNFIIDLVFSRAAGSNFMADFLYNQSKRCYVAQAKAKQTDNSIVVDIDPSTFIDRAKTEILKYLQATFQPAGFPINAHDYLTKDKDHSFLSTSNKKAVGTSSISKVKRKRKTKKRLVDPPQFGGKDGTHSSSPARLELEAGQAAQSHRCSNKDTLSKIIVKAAASNSQAGASKSGKSLAKRNVEAEGTGTNVYVATVKTISSIGISQKLQDASSKNTVSAIPFMLSLKPSSNNSYAKRMAQRKKGSAFDELRSLMKLQDSKLTVKSTGSQIKYNKAAGESEVEKTVAGITPKDSGILAANFTQSTKKDVELRVPHDPVQILNTDSSSTWIAMVLPSTPTTEGICTVNCHSVGADESATAQEEILFEFITNLLANESDERQTESNQQRKSCDTEIAPAPENEIGQAAVEVLKGDYLADEHGIGVRCDPCLPAAAEIVLNTYTEDEGNILSELGDKQSCQILELKSLEDNTAEKFDLKPNTIVAGPKQDLSEGAHEDTFDSADIFLELNLTAQMRDQDLHYGSEGIIDDAYKPVLPGTIANGLLDTNQGAPNLKETQERLVDHNISPNSDIQEGILFNPACAVNREKLPTQDAAITASNLKLTTQEAKPTDASDMLVEMTGTEDETSQRITDHAEKEGKKTVLTHPESQAPASSCAYTKNITQQKKCKLFRSKKSTKSKVLGSFGTTMNNSKSATKHSQKSTENFDLDAPGNSDRLGGTIRRECVNDTADEHLETIHSNPSTSNTSIAKFVDSQRYPNVPTLKISDEAHITSAQPLSTPQVPNMVTEFISYHPDDKMDMDIVTDKKPGVQGGMSRGYKKFRRQSYMNDSSKAAMLSSDIAIANADLDSPTKLNCRSVHNIKRNQSSTVASEKNSKSKYWSGDRYARRKSIKKGLNRNAPGHSDFAKDAKNDSRSYDLSNHSCPKENQKYNSIGVVPKRHETTKVEEDQNEVQDFIEAKAPVPIYGRPVDCEQLSAKLRELLFRLSEAEDQSDGEPKLLSSDSGIDLLTTDQTPTARQGEFIPPDNMSVTPLEKSRPSVLMSWTVERYKWVRKQIDNDDRFPWERFDYTKDYKVDVVDEILRSRTRSAPPVDYHYYQTLEWMRSYFHEEVTGERGLGA